jgi:hypothetical protein
MAALRGQVRAEAQRAGELAAQVEALAAERAAAAAAAGASEGQLLAAVRREAEAAEALLEEERRAHAASRRAAAAREQQLDGAVGEAAAAMAAMQRAADDRAARAAAAEERCGALEFEVEALTRRAGEAEARAGAAGEAAAAAAAAALPPPPPGRVEELEAAAADARRALSAAQASAASAAEEAVRLRAELDTTRRQLAEARPGEAAELRRRLQEATDALYLRQAALERMAADRAAAQLQSERQLGAARAEAGQARRRGAAADRALSGAEDGYGMVPMEALGERYARLANAPGRLGGAVKAGAALLDGTASQAVRVLRHYPLGRLAAFLYLAAMHLFIYLLLHRLQHLAFLAGERGAGGEGAVGNASVADGLGTRQLGRG